MTQIKKLSKMFLILTIVLLVACSSDDSSNSNSYETDIIGTWELLSLTANGIDLLQGEECSSTFTFTATTIVSTDYFDNDDGNPFRFSKLGTLRYATITLDRPSFISFLYGYNSTESMRFSLKETDGKVLCESSSVSP